MITCAYCAVSYEEFQPLCSSCGAALLVNSTTPPSLLASISQICNRYEGPRDFHPGGAIPPEKMRTAMETFTVFPDKAEIFLFCDTHPFEKGKRGLFICADGLYWQNSWGARSHRYHLSWAEFAQREVSLSKYNIELGRGDRIGLAGLGSEEKRESVLRMVTEIRALFDDAPRKQVDGEI